MEIENISRKFEKYVCFPIININFVDDKYIFIIRTYFTVKFKKIAKVFFLFYNIIKNPFLIPINFSKISIIK